MGDPMCLSTSITDVHTDLLPMDIAGHNVIVYIFLIIRVYKGKDIEK